VKADPNDPDVTLEMFNELKDLVGIHKEVIGNHKNQIRDL
jgi:hypothetical protein